MSFRVLHPLWSTSSHGGPNLPRSYPVFGARPFTSSVSSVASAALDSGASLPPIGAAVCAVSSVSDLVGEGDLVSEGDEVGVGDAVFFSDGVADVVLGEAVAEGDALTEGLELGGPPGLR